MEENAKYIHHLIIMYILSYRDRKNKTKYRFEKRIRI